MIGRTGTATEACKPKGTIKIEGTLWQAEALDGSPLEPGWTVVVRDIEGLKLIVEVNQSDDSDILTGD